MEAWSRARRYGFTESELKRQKERILSWIEQVYNDRENIESQDFVEDYIDHFLEDNPIPDIEYEYRLFKKYVPAIAPEEVNRQAARGLSPENRVILISGPEKEAVRVPEKSEVLALFSQVQDKRIDPYEDRVSVEPLVTGSLGGAEITSRKSIPELEVREWQLSNGVWVDSEVHHYPDEEYHVSIGFGCAPKQVEPLTELVFEEIFKSRNKGPDPVHLAKVQEILRRERQTDLKNNEFWLQTLQFTYAHELDPMIILDFEHRLDGLTTEALQQMALEYLDPSNYVRILLYPEDMTEGPDS